MNTKENISLKLYELIKNNNVAEYKQIIDANPELLTTRLNIETDNPNTYFQDAASLCVEFNNKEIFQHILDNHLQNIQVKEDDVIFNSQLIGEMISQQNFEFINLFLAHPKVTKDALDWNDCVHNTTPLCLAINNNCDYATIRKFFELGISPTKKNTFGENAFTSCAKNGDINIYDILNQNNAIDEQDLDIDLIINRSIQYNNAPVFDEIVKKSDKSLDDLFELAIQFKTTQILQTIIMEDSFLPGSDQLNSLTEIVTYVYDNDYDHEAAIFLLDFLCTVKVKFERFLNDEGENIWNLAIDNNNLYLIKKLLEIPEIINQKDADGRTPLMYALDKRMHKMADLILENNPNVNIKDKFGNTALLYATQQNISYLVDPLLKLNAFTFEKNKKGETPLYWATFHRNFPMVAKLLWAGAPIATNSLTVKNKVLTGQVDLAGHVDMDSRDMDESLLNNFKALVHTGFNLDAISEQGLTFPMHFVVNNHISNFASILECYFNPNQQKEADGNTILMECAARTNPMFANLFIKKFGTEIDAIVENDLGQTAIDVAIEKNNHQVLWMILNQTSNIDEVIVAKSVPSLLESQCYSLEEITELCDSVELNIQDILTSDLEDMWFTAIRKESIEDIKFLIVNFSEGPSFTHKNKDGKTIEDVLKSLSNEDFKQTATHILSPRKKPKLA